jgi:outer membrane protein assembly factor BamA
MMRLLLSGLLMLLFLGTHAQDAEPSQVDTLDLNEVFSGLFSKKKDTIPRKPSTISLLPAIGYNPSIGFMLGVNIAGGLYMGDPKNTNLSTGTATAFITSKGILNFQFRHNIFTEKNNYNLQGNIQITKMLVIDYGLGPGSGKERTDTVAFPIKYKEIRINEKLYKRVSKNILVGAGLAFNHHFGIDDEVKTADSSRRTPHYTYSQVYGFDPNKYTLSGLFLNVQYTTRDHLNRAHKGIYADLTFRMSPTWLGSTKKSLQMMTELRKYFSLSAVNPEHVLAFWHLGTFRVGGELPYLDLPATGTDVYNRSGRGYTIGRFRGPSFFYLESEYRFPITENKLFSGVVFANVQTVSDLADRGIFEAFEPAGGAGLRILFNRHTRTNICIDYAVGKYGSKGLFFGLNEVF